MMSVITDALGMNQKPAPLPPPPAPLPPPTIEDTVAKAAQDSDALRRRQGRASTILSGNSTSNTGGAGAPVQTATKALLGS